MTAPLIHESVATVVAATPESVYAVISDPARLAELSPENVSGHWVGGADRATVGARFRGRNVRGSMRWSTTPVVTAADPGLRFAFRIGSGARTTWTYDLQPVPDGTRVTESVRTERPMPRLIGFLMRRAGVDDRGADLRRNIATTLDRLAATV